MKSSIGIALSVSYLAVPRELSSSDTRAIVLSSGASEADVVAEQLQHHKPSVISIR